MVFLRYLLIVLLVLPCSTTATAIVEGETVSARTLSGDELVRIGEIHDVQNHYPEALTYYQQAVKAFRARKQPQGEAIVLTKIASMFERQNRRREAVDHVSRALTLFAKTPGSPVHADALFLSGRLSLWFGAREDAAPLFEQAKERYRRSRNVQALGSVRIQSGLLKSSDGSVDTGLREIQQALDDARSRRDDEQTLTALIALGDANWMLDRTQPAVAHYEEAVSLLGQRPHPSIEASLHIRLAALSGETDRLENGILSAKRAVTLYQSLRDVSGEAAAWALLASLHQALGRPTEAEDTLSRALALYRQQNAIVHAGGPMSPALATVPPESR
jgi:tetratricopeptide (TPR) repeat protein